ncbi:hypothetical protein [Mycobacteroides abscessus]|uniref:hypothetical protein n=1 Tax=Mycobacteroides abscessus TaxID=36809 RepID=UPI0010423D52|nr:hypothetical protein [Mycobacteroides abscessus]
MTGEFVAQQPESATAAADPGGTATDAHYRYIQVGYAPAECRAAEVAAQVRGHAQNSEPINVHWH